MPRDISEFDDPNQIDQGPGKKKKHSAFEWFSAGAGVLDDLASIFRDSGSDQPDPDPGSDNTVWWIVGISTFIILLIILFWWYRRTSKA